MKVTERISKEAHTITFELADKQRALHDLGLHTGIFPKDGASLELTITGPVQFVITQPTLDAI